ncbi:hypothetical protein SLS62_003925 [Diatrype stigma]|uniref:Major facilitator superfamily (MFS) profile domain-containing protein n=1 Tax=Diatrype stigma TaxID=117547 RepID=A0AAN9V423_9PEZI
MCVYPKTVFCCNHVQHAENPIRICEEQKGYLSKRASEPCNEIRSHALSTVKQPFECICCKEKKAALNMKLSEARRIIAEVKGKLQESYGRAFDDNLKDTGLNTSEDMLNLKYGGSGDENGFAEPDILDPVEYLKKRLSDKYAHLMMDTTTQADDVEQSTTREVEPLDLELIAKDQPDSPSDGGFTSTSGTPALKAENLIEGHCCAAVLTPEPAAVQLGDHSSDYPQGARFMGIVAALLLMVPKVTDEFKGLDHVSWYGSAYFMTMGGTQPTWGKAYKVIGRAIVGVGAAGIVTGTFTIIGFVASPEKRPFFTGLMGGVYGIACLLAPLLGGAFADKSVAGVSSTVSGQRNLPILLTTSAFMAISGAVVSAVGSGTPVMALAAAIATLGVSLLYTLDIGSEAGKWISYQILAGTGYGLGFQVPLMMVQDGTKPQDLAAVTAMILFSSYLGGSFLVVSAQAAFVSRLVAQISKTVPGIEPSAVVDTGAAELQHKFGAAHLPGVLAAYMSGLRVVFAIAVGGISLALLISPLNCWRRPKSPAPSVENNEGAA